MPQGEGARFRVRLFGAPAVIGPNGPVRLSPLQMALVAVVYGHGSAGISRSRSIRLLWGTEATSDARHRLRQLLLEVSTRVGSRIIDTNGDMLKPSAAVASDLDAFDKTLASGSLFDAALVARGGFAELERGSVADAYGDWSSAASISHGRRLRVQALSRWRAASGEGDWLTAKDAAEALFALDPTDSDSAIRMIEVLANCGQPESAEKIFVEYAQRLPADAVPPAALVAAIERARRLRRVRATALGPAQDDIPLIGRRDALAQARSIFDDVQRERFAFLLVAGESGIGKTRMLRELHREAALRDFRCLEAQAVELECRIPLNPLLDALKSVDLGPHLRAIGAPWNAVVGTMLPAGTLDGPAAPPPPIQEGALTRRLLDAFALLFENLATEQPTLLFLDDLQWADATTVSALQFMQRRWSRGAFGVIASLRPDLVDAEHPVAKYLSACSEGDTTRRVDLTELSADAALHLVEIIGNGEIGNELAQRICALAGLHPLYLTELARDYLAGRLRLPELPEREVTIPVSLRQILDTRLRYLSDPALKIAGLLAVAAQPMRLADAARLANLGIDAAVDVVDELRRSRLIEYDRDRVRIVHELFRSAIYQHLSEPRRVVNHRAVAELLETSSAGATGELAFHYSRAGESKRAVQHAWIAAERAIESGAVTEAAHFFQLVAENDTNSVRKADATAGQARALYLARDIGRANVLLELASQRLSTAGRPTDALRLDIKRVEGLAEVAADSLRDLLGRLASIKVEARRRQDWEGLALALDVELNLLHRSGNVTGIRSLFQEMRDVAERGSTEATVLCSAGLALGVLFGDPEEALCAARRAVALAEVGRSYRLKALLRLMVVLQYRGMLELRDWKPVVQEAREQARRSGDVLTHFSIENNLAVAALDSGNLEVAEVQMMLCSALAGSADMDLNRFIQSNNKAELALAQGRYHDAEAAYEEAASYARSNTPAYMMDLVHAGLGLCALEMGNLSEARRREQELLPAPQSWHFDPTTILGFRARLLELRQRREEAIELLEEASVDLHERLVLAWLKVQAQQTRLLKKVGDVRAKEVALNALERAKELHLTYRAREFALLLDGL
jgi:hypothetical protein